MGIETWKPCKLDSLGFIGRGKSKNRPRNDPSLYGGNYPFVQTGDIKEAGLYLSSFSQTYNEKGLAQSKLWDGGTLCITIAANIAETTILGIKACFPDSIVGFIADPNKADVRFIKYYIDTIKLQMQSISRGTTQDNLSLDKLLSFKILTPPIDTQRIIASILSAYDDLIENNTRRIRILEEMAQAIYREWFVNFRFPGHEGVRMVESAVGRIPEGWRIGYFTDYIDVLSGGTPKTTNPEYWGTEIPWFTPQDLTGNYFILDTTRKITKLGLKKCNSKLYPRNTVFITARGTVGKCVLAAVPMAMSQTSYALIGKNGIPQYFVFLLAKNKVDYLKQQATGAVFDTIIVDTFRKLQVMIPTAFVLDQFHNHVAPIFLLIENLQKRNFNLRQQRDLLLPRLVSGELDVGNIKF
jgi:type I restriction enzyme S subunit